MIRTLFARGLLIGLLAGLLAAGFAFAIGEPHVDQAIALEEAAAAQQPADGATHEQGGDEPPVSRGGQKIGLFLALALYGTAVGGLYALAYAAVRGRVGPRTEPALAISLAAALFVAVVLVPFLKYPGNPPAVGDPESIGPRTMAYLLMVVTGLISLAAAVAVARTVRQTAPPWVRGAAVLAGFVIPVTVAVALLPAVNEVPPGFPADLLWDFRVASLGMQLVLWMALGTLFGIVSERSRNQAVEAS